MKKQVSSFIKGPESGGSVYPPGESPGPCDMSEKHSDLLRDSLFCVDKDSSVSAPLL